MACYIASNDNRAYAAIETSYCTAAAASASGRLPIGKLSLRHVAERPARRDKTGHRTYPGLGPVLRRHTDFEVETFLAAWDPAEAEPRQGALVQASLGEVPLTFAGAIVSDAPDATTLQMAAPHGLVAGQAVLFEDELRFVAAVVDPVSVVINAPFKTTPGVGATLGETVTYLPAKGLPSVTLYDYWSPAEAVQRLLAGAGVNRMRFLVNGDFHQIQFAGRGAELVDDRTFVVDTAGLSAFPAEPAGPYEQFSLVPGSLGQAWLGAIPSKFFTVLRAEILLDNGLEQRSREFGSLKPKCLVPGQRSVTLDVDLMSNTSTPTTALYEAAAQRSPITVMFQLGQQQRSLCGVYLPAVVPEVPEFDDGETKLRWRFRDCRAQGVGDDEIVVAFG